LFEYFTHHGMFLATVEAFKVILARHEASHSMLGILASILQIVNVREILESVKDGRGG
jgi:hypothetical protein